MESGSVNENAAAPKPGYKPRRMPYAGAGWVASNLNRDLSEFERRAADLLGAVWRGIYHLEDGVSPDRGAEWRPDRVSVIAYGAMSTFDRDDLSALVVLAHDACVRVNLAPAKAGTEADNERYGPLDLRITLTPREREGDIWDRHPTMERAVHGYRTRLADLRDDAALEADQMAALTEAEAGLTFAISVLAQRGGCNCSRLNGVGVEGFVCSPHQALASVRKAIAAVGGQPR